MKFSSYRNLYARKNRFPKYWHLILIILSILRRGQKVFFDFVWFVRANKLTQKGFSEDNFFPTIDIAILATQKDFRFLCASIENAIKSSVNPVSEIKIVVPKKFERQCRELLKGNWFSREYVIKVMNDEQLINYNLRHLIASYSQNSYGWLIQQFLKIKLGLETSSSGVLVVDSDTLLLGRNEWLRSDGTQLLTAADNRFIPYFKFLKQIGFEQQKFCYSFVCHHMLYKPSIIKSLLDFLGCDEFDDFVFTILNAIGDLGVSSVSVDFELYGQYAVQNFAREMRLSRFCNLSLPSSTKLRDFEGIDEIAYYSTLYNSVSFHSWN